MTMESNPKYYTCANGYCMPCRLDESMLTPPDMATIDDIWSEREEIQKERNFFRWVRYFGKRK